ADGLRDLSVAGAAGRLYGCVVRAADRSRCRCDRACAGRSGCGGGGVRGAAVVPACGQRIAGGIADVSLSLLPGTAGAGGARLAGYRSTYSRGKQAQEKYASRLSRASTLI